MILNKAQSKAVRAKGPSLNAILAELKWSRDEVVSTQISTRGADEVFIVNYEGPIDTTWLDA